MTPEPPTPSPEPRAPPPALGGRPPPSSGHQGLLRKIRSHQRRNLWLRATLFGLSAFCALLLAACFTALWSPPLGRALALLAPLAFLSAVLGLGLFPSIAKVGNDERAARLAGMRLPELALDLLGAVELRRALSGQPQFSPELARAFLAQVDLRSEGADARRVIDSRRTRAALLSLGLCVLLCALSLVAWPGAWLRGARLVFHSPELPSPASPREPITGEVELSYRYPAYTGLSPRTVPGTSGEISAPAGTEVQLKTRADREVARAEISVNGKAVPLRIAGGRDLLGSFVVQKPGSYSFVFLKQNGRRLAQGPEVPIHVEADAPPQARLLSPRDELEIDPGEPVTVKFEASDDYGLSSLSLVYRAPGSTDEQRLSVPHDEGRRAKGQLRWELGALKLKPGQQISYYLEARDNDQVEGNKKGVSRTQSLKLYSAAEHRQEAVRRAEALWEKLVLHLADRLEGPDRAPAQDLPRVTSAQAVDSSGLQLASEMLETSSELGRERDAPRELAAALANIGEGARRAVRATSDARRLFLRFQRAKGQRLDAAQRLTQAVSEEISESERNVLYLESLIDRQKLHELRQLAEELGRQRRELASLIEEYRKTQDPKLQAAILQEIQKMREQLNQLMRRMSELAKGIRDEHLNQEALKELMEEKDLSSALDEIERLLREGKAEEALAKLQELAMQMEEMLQGLEEAEESAGTEQHPELAKKFQELWEDLKDTSAQQKELAERTRQVRDRYREQMKDRVTRRGRALKDQLLRKAEELAQEYRGVPPEQLAPSADPPLEEIQGELENLRNALQVEDYDLSAEAAARAEHSARRLAEEGEVQRRRDELFQNPSEVRQKSRQLAERLQEDAAQVEELNRQLQQLFPQPGSLLGEEDRQKLSQLAKEQKGLERRAQGLAQKMEELSELAPIFGEEEKEQLGQVEERMREAARRLEGREVGRGHGEQKAALEQLMKFQEQMRQAKSKGGKRGLPLPMLAGRRDGLGHLDQERVEIPEEDPSQAPREFRKDLLDAMKQGAPDRYRDQVKRYYEELVK